MKKLSLLILILAAGLMASAQLENTKWKGIANVPDPYECMFDFRKDTVYLMAGEAGLLETMRYTLKGDTLILTKIEGKSPCEAKSSGYFKIEKKQDAFQLTSLKDDCQGRAEAFVASPWVRQKE
ncbi:MAG: hypothetical protein ABW007_14190 [Chitinophagaceae bacterium]